MTPMVSEIQQAVCAHFGLKMIDLISPCRRRSIARPRQIAMWLANRRTNHSLPAIGRLFGGRDHTTVIHSIRQIERLMAEIPEIYYDVFSVEEALESIMSDRVRKKAA